MSYQPAPPPPPKPYSQSPSHSAPPPPSISSPTQQHYSAQPPLPPHPTQSYQPTQQSQSQPQPQPLSFPLPPSLLSKSTADLSTLLANPTLLDALVHSHPSHLASLQPLQSQISTNLALAAQLSNTENEVRRMRELTGQLMMQHTSLQTQWRRKQGEMDAALEPWAPRAMYRRLGGSIVEQEALVRAVGESFLEGGGVAEEREVNEWMRRVREEGVKLERRREMSFRWDEGRVGGWR